MNNFINATIWCAVGAVFTYIYFTEVRKVESPKPIFDYVYACPYTPKGCIKRTDWHVFQANYVKDQKEALRKVLP